MYFLKVLKFFFVSVACALFLTACGGGDTPEAVAQDFMKAIVAGDTDKVISAIDIPAEEAAQLEQMRPKLDMIFKEMKKEMDATGGGVKSIEVVSSKISDDGNTAQVVLKVELKNGESKDLPPLPLKKVDGKWKVTQ